MPSDHPQNQSRRALRTGGLVAMTLAAVIVVIGIVTRVGDGKKLEAWTEEQALANVSVVTPGATDTASSIDLPARFEAYIRAPIYARTSGYLKKWYVDIGAKVRAGQVLADLETPDLDQQLLQARADLATAKANEALAKTTADRWTSLLDSGSGAVAPQEVDEKKGDYAAKQAVAKAALANVDRLIATKGFAHLVAPFDGAVTARNTDVGALVSEGGGANSPALFEVSDTRKLRLFVNIPQNHAFSIKPGVTTATITVPEHPGQTFTATVESSAQAVDSASNSMLVQLIVDNRNNQLLSGGYANVSFKLPNAVTALSIPSSALIFNKSGLQVATVGDGNKVKLNPVTIARDLGRTVEIGSGLTPADQVIENPPDGVVDGQMVRVAENEKKEQSAAKH
ncbi:MAG: efflux RND transporter periplasmic adaptor subunit [Azonexus sp.]|jgi:RND family efflux transporter MFP subunit|nr:efflux RND transporter periplasmic adaptor subunit [Azonexus sp.]